MSAPSLGLGSWAPFAVRLLGEQATLGLKLLLHQVSQLSLLCQHRQEGADELVVVVRPPAVVHHIFTPLVDFVLECTLACVDLSLNRLQQSQQVMRCKWVLLS